MTAATRSSRFFRHRRRSIRSPHPAADMHRTSNKILVIATPVRTPVWQSVPLLHRTSNLCVGVGFYPARSAAPSQLSPVGRHPCVPPPTRPAPPQKPCHCEERSDVAIRTPPHRTPPNSAHFLIIKKSPRRQSQPPMRQFFMCNFQIPKNAFPFSQVAFSTSSAEMPLISAIFSATKRT